jgi:GT2 family glycosyltransferase
VSYAVVVPTVYPDLLERLDASIDVCAPDLPRERKIAVVTGTVYPDERKWTVVPGSPEPRGVAYNANLGMRLVRDLDILFMQDDATFCNLGDLDRLAAIAARHPSIGILAPQVIGGVGHNFQTALYPLSVEVKVSGQRLVSICWLIKRAVIDRIGYFDERFTGYGGDDTDYCLRAQMAGFQLAVTPRVAVKHGADKWESSVTFRRLGIDCSASAVEAERLLQEKWDSHPDLYIS